MDEVSREHRRGCSAEKPKARIGTFVVGSGVDIREKVQWWLKGVKYKASFLLPDESEVETSAGLLISEVSFMHFIDLRTSLKWEKWLTTEFPKVVAPGFEFANHDFLRKSEIEELPSKFRD